MIHQFKAILGQGQPELMLYVEAGSKPNSNLGDQFVPNIFK